MALIKCKECGHEVSDKASACPNCGCPLEKESICNECGQLVPNGVDVCPNCHAMLHRKKGLVEPETLKKKLNEQKMKSELL